MNPQDTNGWQEFKRLIIFRLDDQKREMQHVNRRLGRIETGVAALKVKAGVWGALAGLVPAVAGVLLYLALR